jgi:UDP-GlcNAc3NAcA epimerase
MLTIAEQYEETIVLPLHPRTLKKLPTVLTPKLYKALGDAKNIRIIEPVSFFDIIMLEKNAKLVMTDSGGVQKESFFFLTPSIILRAQTEWVEIINAEAGILADADSKRIIEAYSKLIHTKVQFPQLFGDANAAEFILTEITKYLS